jgi:hypothetical protein
MAIRYELRLAEGDGTFDTNLSDWHVGTEFWGDGNVQYRITAIIPIAKIEEFVDAPLHEVWEVEPI